MNRRLALIAFVSVAVIAAGAVYVATRTDPERLSTAGGDPSRLPVLADEVPDLAGATEWLNGSPLSPADLDGKVVVYDFWTYSCVNCVRTLPYLRAWYERYRDDGLVIVGVHTPEFDFEHDRDNVEDAVEDLGVTWPVALDNDQDVWDAFGNRYWPAKYVTDRRGRLRFTHFGEGAYDHTEDVLRELLGVSQDSPRAAVGEGASESAASAGVTPETYLGDERGRLAPPQDLDVGQHDFVRPENIGVDEVALDGMWLVAPEYVQSSERGAAVVLRYRGGEVNLVMAPPDGDAGPIDVEIRLDGERHATVTVDAPQMYRLVTDGPPGDNLLEIAPTRAGLRAYAFTFGE